MKDFLGQSARVLKKMLRPCQSGSSTNVDVEGKDDI